MTTITAQHYPDVSFVAVYENNQHLGSVSTTGRLHKERAEGIYKTVKTELATYGTMAGLDTLFHYRQRKEI